MMLSLLLLQIHIQNLFDTEMVQFVFQLKNFNKRVALIRGILISLQLIHSQKCGNRCKSLLDQLEIMLEPFCLILVASLS